MPFARPTLEQLIERTLADASSRINGASGTVLRRSVLGVLMRIVAGASHLQHGHLDYLSRQIIPDTAEAEFLDRWADVWGLSRKAAEYATGNVTLTGTNGVTLAAGAVLVRADGLEFTTDDDATISGGTATVAVTASTAGQDSNTDASASLSFQSPVVGIGNTATVAAGGLSGGADVETDEELRDRLRARISSPPAGGNANDYVAWALEVPGVTRAWCYENLLGVGTVSVYFVRDNDASIFPDAGEVETVQDYIDERRPVCAAVTVAAPTAKTQNFVIQLDPNTAAVQAAVEAELRDLIDRDTEPGGTLLLSRVREAVSIAAGESNNVVTTPNANVTSAAGELIRAGSFTFSVVP